MELFNEKWNNSSIVTKAAMFAMALSALMLLICSIMFFALGASGNGVFYLFFFLFTALLAFGLLKVNNVARVVTIYGGLAILIPFVLLAVLAIFALIRFPLLKTLLSGYFALLKGIVPFIMSLVPADKKALGAFLLIVFIGPFVLNVFSMLLLLIFRNDFRSKKGKKSKLVAYLLWLFLGCVSAHKFYLEKDGAAIAFFLTGQALLLGWFIGLFTLGKQVDAYNAKLDNAPVNTYGV